MNDKILDWSKLKALEDVEIKEAENSNLFLGRVENIVGKGENAGYLNFFKRLLRGWLKVVILRSRFKRRQQTWTGPHFAGDKLNTCIANMTRFVFDTIKNIVGI